MEFPIDRLHPNNNRGYAYIEFATADEAETAMKHMDGGQVDGQEVTVAPILVPRNRGGMGGVGGGNPGGIGGGRRMSPMRGGGGRGRWRTPPRFRRRSPPRRRSPRRRSRSPVRRRRRSNSSDSSR